MLIDFLKRQRLFEDDKGTPNGGSAQEPPAQPAPASQSEDDDFDKERALATIRKLREFEKGAKAQLNELEQLRAEKAQRDEAELTASQKAEKKAQELEAKWNEAQARLRLATLKDAARASADSLSLPFAPGALDDALALGTFNDLEIDDDGKVKGMNEALKQLQKTRPYLFALPKVPDIDANGRGGTTKQKEAEAKNQRNFRAWGIRASTE